MNFLFLGKTQMKQTWSQPVKPTLVALRWSFPSMRRDWHGIPVQRMKLSSTSSGSCSLLHSLCPFPQDWIFSCGMPSSFSYLSYNPCIVWQSRRAVLLYILAQLFVREHLIVWRFKIRSSIIILWFMYWQLRNFTFNRTWRHP